MSKSVKIMLVVGAILIAAVIVYLVYPAGEEAAPERGVGAARAAQTEAAE